MKCEHCNHLAAVLVISLSGGESYLLCKDCEDKEDVLPTDLV